MVSPIIRTLLLVSIFKVAAFSQAPTIVVPTSHNQKIGRIVIDAQNHFFYTADDTKIIMWDFKTMKQLYSFNIYNKSTRAGTANTVSNLKELSISPDGKIIAFTTIKDSLKIFSTTTGKILQKIPGISSKFIFSKNSKIIYHLVDGPLLKNSENPDGRIVKTIEISSGIVRDYWHLKELNVFGLYARYFFPLTNSRVINFNEKGYQILDLDNKTEITSVQISAEAKKKFADPNSPFNENYFTVYPESGLFVFQLHTKTGLGNLTWDIYNNKEFAFVPAYAPIDMQGSFNSESLLYITSRGTRFNKQELVIYSNGYKIEKKKLLNISDEIYIAALSKSKNTVIYIDYNNKLYKTNVSTGDKETVEKGLPEINFSSFFRDRNMLSFNGSTIFSDNINQGTFENFKSDYMIDLNRASVYAHDTMPSILTSVVSSIRLSKDSFLINYNTIAKDISRFFIYDKQSKKSTAFIAKDFFISNVVGSSDFSGTPKFFTLNEPGIAYYTLGEYGAKNTDPYTYNLYRYNISSKKSEKIFIAKELGIEKWQSLGGSSIDCPSADQQLIIDKKSEILAAAEYDFKGSIRIIDIKTSKVISKHSIKYDSAALGNNYINQKSFEKEGNNYRPFILKQVKQIDKNLVRVLGSETIYEFNLANGSVTENKFVNGSIFDDKQNVNIFGSNKLETILASYEDDNESIVKVVYGPNKYTLDYISSPVMRIEFTDNDSILYTIHADKSINVYNAVTGKFYGSLYVFENSADWVFVDAAGRFDGTDGGMKRLYYLRDREIINLDKVYEKYFTPNLFQRLVNGEEFEPIPEINIKPKPSSKILYAQKQRNLEVDDDKLIYSNTTGVAEITVSATAPEDKIDEIRLFHNGKIVNLATRGLFVTDNDGTETKKYTINLLAGQNTFRAVALNSQRTESEPDEITVAYQVGNQPIKNTPNNAVGVTAIDAVDKNATLHLLVVGINKYQNTKMSLNYALADATAFKDEIERSVKTVLGNVKTYFVTDDKADKNGITAAFAEVQKNAKAQDVFVFYYAGHGVISEKNKEFYLVPTDVIDLKNVDAALEEKGIPSKLLQQYAVDIQAQKQVFILDACQSAGAFETLMSDNGNQQKSLAVVARSTGTHWMAASGSKQFANEFSSLGHGVFTYVLLQALKGDAATNKMITVNGLKNFIQVQVPELMKKYSGTLQYPSSYGFGNDFPVEVLK